MTRQPKTAVRDDAQHEGFLASLREIRRWQIRAARILLRLDECCHFVFEGCANIAEYGVRHGLSPAEARRLTAVGLALERAPNIEELLLDGSLSLEAAAIVGRALSNAALLKAGDDWVGWATTSSVKELNKLLRRRMEEARMEQSPVTMTLFVTPKGREDFDRARTIASRKKRRLLTDGETLETVVDHYLDSFDPERKNARARRAGDTRDPASRGRYVPAAVRRAVGGRRGDRCAVPGCLNEIFLDYAHLRGHATGGDREAENLLRLCRIHHVQLDRGVLTFRGTAEAPVFVNMRGVVIGSGAKVGGAADTS